MNRIIFTLLFFGLSFSSLFAQHITDEKEKDFIKAVQLLESSTGIKVLFRKDYLRRLNLEQEQFSVSMELLDQVTENTSMSYFLIEDAYAVIYPRAMRDRYLAGRARRRADPTALHQFQGRIMDEETGLPIPGALMYIPSMELGITTDERGRFSTDLPEGTHVAVFSAMGKETERRIIRAYDPVEMSISLFESMTQMDEFIVTDRSIDHNVRSIELGVNRLNISELKLMPPLLGEVDIIRSIQLLPGVSTVGEGASGFNVRGGGVDQNLILMDGAPIFNPSHMFGFFSIFNADMVENVALHKGDIPANYGGRLSSVLDVTMQEGSREKMKAEGGIGFLSSRLKLEGPVNKNTTVAVAGRVAYPNWIMHRIRSSTLQSSSSYFYDGNIKINHQINDRNNLKLSGYASNDYFRVGADTAYSWQTHLASLKWSSIISESLASDLTVAYSNYTYSVEGTGAPLQFQMQSDIDYMGIDHNFEWNQSDHANFIFGYNVSHYAMGMGAMEPTTENSTILPEVIPTERGLEAALFATSEIFLTDKWAAQLGLRYSNFFALGPNETGMYEEGQPRNQNTFIGNRTYENNEVITRYGGLEPRLGIRFATGENSSLKLSFNRNLQYIHLLSNTMASAPVDLWKLSDYHVGPQESLQYALGYYQNFKENIIESSVEVYYKDFPNILEFKDGATLLMNPNLEQELLGGIGHAYGAEFFLKKRHGKLTGWISYGFSRTMRQVVSEFEEETINQGEFFPSNWDQPHDLSVVATYQLTRRLSFSGNFNYRSGRPITLPTSIYTINDNIVIDYSHRNQGRIPDYHRMDLSLTYDGNQRKSSTYKSNVTLALYNVYARRNPFSWFFSPTGAGTVPRSYRLAVIGTMIPSVTYNFQFK
ncbi:TonB-dependent receptor [Litoribacter ruber]|uniref:TonB-dependent receptor n=1 Tax=Litoribacter ruber TaxID=702568 RepID=UPI001BDAC8F5|nr:TonB-dependent receptor [Litoribacter ruber]MBT0812152.1 TonB-dependent receptor [Litoribacter ruber]